MKKSKLASYLFFILTLVSCSSMEFSLPSFDNGGNLESSYEDSNSVESNSSKDIATPIDSSSSSSQSSNQDSNSSIKEDNSSFKESTQSSSTVSSSSKEETVSSSNQSSSISEQVSSSDGNQESSQSHASSDSKEEGKDSEDSSSDTNTESSSSSEVNPPIEEEDPYHPTPYEKVKNLPFADKFNGSWNRPGLYNEDGSIHQMPKPVQETGKIVDVMNYGAQPNNSSFDNYSAFLEAIIKLKAGDTLYIPNGKYYFKNYAGNNFVAHIAISEKNNVTIRGESKENTILVSNFDVTNNETNSTTLISVINSSNVAIKNLTVTSVFTDDELPNPDDSKSMPANYKGPKYGITFATKNPKKLSDQTSNAIVENCLIERFIRCGVRIDCAKECVVSSCTFQKAAGLGGGGAGYGVDIQGKGNNYNDLVNGDGYLDAKFNVVTGCTFQGPYIRHGALIQYYAHNNLIHDNTFDGTLLDAIDMHGEDEYSNEICHNIAKSRSGAGVGLGNTGGGEEGAPLGGNRHDASGRNHFIHDNVISNSKRGIDIMLDTPNTFIYNNEIKNITGTGIKVTSSSGVYVVQNKLTNIPNKEAVIIAEDEMTNYSFHDFLFFKNIFDNCKYGIRSSFNITNIKVENNEFKNMNDTYCTYGTIPNNEITQEPEPEPDPEPIPTPDPGEPDSNIHTPVYGTEVKPIDGAFIYSKEKDTVEGSSKLVIRSSKNANPTGDRMTYLLWDKSKMPTSYQKVYFRVAMKIQYDPLDYSIYTNTTFTNWSSSSLTWNNAKLHDNNAIVKNTTSDPVTLMKTFYVGKEYADYKNFYIFYIDVTDGFKNIPKQKFTMTVTNESQLNIYSEMRGLTNSEYPRFIFVD